MEKYFALIKNNLVNSVIVATDEFIPLIKHKYEIIVDVTNKTRPNVGDSYYSDIDTFIPNTIGANHINVDLQAEHLKTGTEEGFEPFTLSKYSVKYDNGMVHIGCKSYTPAGLFDALHKVLIEDTQTTHCFTTLEDGPAHGKFGITWDDAQKLYDVLLKVKF